MTNTVSSLSDRDLADWRKFDALPHERKSVIWGASQQWSPSQISRRYTRQIKNAPHAVVIERLITGLRKEEAKEIRDFARQYEGPYPHLAAQVPVLKFERRIVMDVEPRFRSEPVRSPDHLEWVRGLGCGIPGCRGGLIDAHHVRSARTAGTGVKPCDSLVVNLCRSHHQAGHQGGWKTFERQQVVNLTAHAAYLAGLSPDPRIRATQTPRMVPNVGS